MNRTSFFRGSAVVSAGCFLSKLIGGLSRVPVLAILGCKGMGLYQLVYPLYAFLLTFCSSGVSTAIAKMVAEEKYLGGAGVYRRALVLFGSLGFLVGAVLFLCANAFSFWLGEPLLASSFRVIAPSLFAVSLLSVLRGWFQGKKDMLPTAFSMVEENCLKVLLGSAFSLFAKGELTRKVFFFFLGATASESISCYSLFRNKKRSRYLLPLYTKTVSVEELWKTSFPIALSVSVLPLSSLLDSALIVRLLSSFEENALSAYGIFSGGALTFINIPASVCYGVAVSIVPQISSQKVGKERQKSVTSALILTAVLSLFGGVALFLFCPLATRLLFSSLSGGEKSLLISLTRSMLPAAFFLPLVQTLSACLSAKGGAGKSTLALLSAVLLKTLLLFFFVTEKNGIVGAARALNICYFVAFVLNFIGNLLPEKGEEYDNHRRTRRGMRRFDKKRRASDLIGG